MKPGTEFLSGVFPRKNSLGLCPLLNLFNSFTLNVPESPRLPAPPVTGTRATTVRPCHLPRGCRVQSISEAFNPGAVFLRGAAGRRKTRSPPGRRGFCGVRVSVRDLHRGGHRGGDYFHVKCCTVTLKVEFLFWMLDAKCTLAFLFW